MTKPAVSSGNEAVLPHTEFDMSFHDTTAMCDSRSQHPEKRLDVREIECYTSVVRRPIGFSLGCVVMTALLGFGGASGRPATVTRTVDCLLAHQVIAAYAPSIAKSYRLRTGKSIKFTFTGIPKKALDGGSIVFEPTNLRAQNESQQIYRELYAYAITHTNGITPAFLKTELKKMIQIVGNAIELWGDAHISPSARRIVGLCLTT